MSQAGFDGLRQTWSGSRAADITTATLSLIERGQANPTWDTIKKVAASLGSSMGELGKLADKLER